MDKRYKKRSSEEVEVLKDKTLEEIKRDFKIQTFITLIVIVLALYICFKSMKLAIDYEVLNKEKKELEDLVNIQDVLITDLEENCKGLFEENQKLKFEEEI